MKEVLEVNVAETSVYISVRGFKCWKSVEEEGRLQTAETLLFGASTRQPKRFFSERLRGSRNASFRSACGTDTYES
jgi:hypothetical protein